jgi:hypothetical protein
MTLRPRASADTNSLSVAPIGELTAIARINYAHFCAYIAQM